MSDAPRGSRIVRCPACQRYYRMGGAAQAPGARLRCTKCGEVFPLEGPAAPPPPAKAAPARSQEHAHAPAARRGRVLVATDGDEFQALIAEVLTQAAFELLPCRTGDAAWERIAAWRPHVALLDVALPLVPAFEICDRVRADAVLRGTGLILIASVFQQTRYKRAPTSLYGADDYIEKHHIRDWLVGKVERLLPTEGAAKAQADAARPPASPAHAFLHDAEKRTLIQEEYRGPRERHGSGASQLRESLRRYARIIVSDIALYNQELVERGIREGTFAQLLGGELEEGRRLYLTRVPQGAGGAEHYEEAVRDFVAARSGGRGAQARPGGGAGHGRT